MPTRYYCENPKRLQKIKTTLDGSGEPRLNSIDYLEVLDNIISDKNLKQRILLVYCVKSVTNLNISNVHIEGGVRRTVKVVEASAASLWTGPLGGLSKAAVLDKDDEGNIDETKILITVTDAIGDFSTYRLKLVKSITDDNPPEGFDPLLSQINFSFKVECPTEFDCRSVTVNLPQNYIETKIDYLAKDYASFRKLLLDRLSTILPDWQERNTADTGVVLVESLAYIGDYLSYYQDAVANEAYLGTARKRISVRRHAKLIDYSMHEGCNARVWVQLQTSDSDDVFVKSGVSLMTRIEGFSRRFKRYSDNAERIDSDDYIKAIYRGPEVFETMHEAVICPGHKEINFYTWGDEDCCLRKGATQATLLDKPETPLRLRAGDILIFEEIRSAETGLTSEANPGRRHAVRLTEVYPEAELVLNPDETKGLVLKKDGAVPQSMKDPLNGTPVVDIKWATEDALPFSLCLKEVADPNVKTGPQPVSIARGNIVLAENGRTILEGENEIPISLSQPVLKNAGITHHTAYNDSKARLLSAAKALEQDPRQALASVKLFDHNKKEWIVRDDLLESGRFDRDFIVEIEEDGKGHLRFGDGKNGELPEVGTRFSAEYQIGNGHSGNVGAEAIYHVVTDDTRITEVRNPMPACGGTDVESVEEVRLYAPQAFRTQKRAVNSDDYAAAAMLHPEVQKAIATQRWTGSWHVMFITIDRKNGKKVDDAFEKELVDFIDQFRLAGHDIEIEPPKFIPLDITMTVCVNEHYFRDKVKLALLETFDSGYLSSGQRGFFHPDNFTFGQPVYLSRVISVAMNVPGVKWVDLSGASGRFQRWGELANNEIAEGMIKIGRLEIARLDNDPNAPENGKIEFIMKGGL
jgi:hypothetical protein